MSCLVRSRSEWRVEGAVDSGKYRDRATYSSSNISSVFSLRFFNWNDNEVSDRPAIFNILILQGSDWDETTIQLCNSVRISCGAKIGQTYLNIDPLGSALGIGDSLKYGRCSFVTISAIAHVGDESIQILPLPSAIAANSELIGYPLNLTGCTGLFQIKKNYADLIPLASGIPAISALSGLISPSLPNLVTASLVPTCTWQDLPDDLQDKESFLADPKLKKIWNAAYFWDLKLFSSSGIVSREVEGRSFVSSEITR